MSESSKTISNRSLRLKDTSDLMEKNQSVQPFVFIGNIWCSRGNGSQNYGWGNLNCSNGILKSTLSAAMRVIGSERRP